MEKNHWHEEVPSHDQFLEERKSLKSEMRFDTDLHSLSLEMFSKSRKYKFGYHSDWLGVPIIRHPEDLIRQQEIIFKERPDLIVEVGVARGGGLIFSASMQELIGLTPRVLGIDNKIFPHTFDAISRSRYVESIVLFQADSVSKEAEEFFASCVEQSTKVLLILDSDHSSDHVLAELQSFYKHLPIDSIVMVCDTIVDDFPPQTFPNRTWSNGKGPRDAIARFSELNPSAFVDVAATEDLLLTEMRGGIIRKNFG